MYTRDATIVFLETRTKSNFMRITAPRNAWISGEIFYTHFIQKPVLLHNKYNKYVDFVVFSNNSSKSSTRNFKYTLEKSFPQLHGDNNFHQDNLQFTEAKTFPLLKCLLSILPIIPMKRCLSLESSLNASVILKIASPKASLSLSAKRDNKRRALFPGTITNSRRAATTGSS